MQILQGTISRIEFLFFIKTFFIAEILFAYTGWCNLNFRVYFLNKTHNIEKNSNFIAVGGGWWV